MFANFAGSGSDLVNHYKGLTTTGNHQYQAVKIVEHLDKARSLLRYGEPRTKIKKPASPASGHVDEIKNVFTHTS